MRGCAVCVVLDEWVGCFGCNWHVKVSALELSKGAM